MNRQMRADLRSLVLHQQIAKRLQEDPTLWKIPQHNIERWLLSDTVCQDLLLWKQLFQSKTKEQILTIITSESEESTRLRSTSPFAGVLDQATRSAIFRHFLHQEHTHQNAALPTNTP